MRKQRRWKRRRRRIAGILDFVRNHIHIIYIHYTYIIYILYIYTYATYAYTNIYIYMRCVKKAMLIVRDCAGTQHCFFTEPVQDVAFGCYFCFIYGFFLYFCPCTIRMTAANTASTADRHCDTASPVPGMRSWSVRSPSMKKRPMP